MTIAELRPQIDDFLQTIPSNGTMQAIEAGEDAAKAVLEKFINDGLERYATKRSEPALSAQSGLSPYLHFGQISSLQVIQRLMRYAEAREERLHIFTSPKMPKGDESKHSGINGANALLEEMIVRKELADNFCFYAESYSSLIGAPAWARQSLDAHRSDARARLYDIDELRNGLTHDSAWNAAQLQLISTGKMHGYMRMYWAKKVLEWTSSPEEAIRVLIQLNDFYSLDGGDPNGYAGILWSIAGVHDRPWTERPIFGKIRYMNYDGLKRKFKISEYEARWADIGR